MASSPARRVLIITHEPLRKNLSGPGIRAIEMGRALARRYQVTLATPFPPEIADSNLTWVTYTFGRRRTLESAADAADVIVLQGFTLTRFPFLARLQKPIVVDLYCPFTIEHLEMLTARPDLRAALATDAGVVDRPALDIRAVIASAGVLEVQNTQLGRGDFFLCANERQRDFWLGALHTAGRVNPWTYARDPTLRSLIDVVPFGVPDEPPMTASTQAAGRRVLKGARPGIAEHDYVLLWGGSILDWQDPKTLILAVAEIAQRRTDVKLFFMGTRHPNPQVPPIRAVAESIDLARQLNLLNSCVFFNDWVPYAERGRFLVEADLGLSTHRLHLETHLSFRTRILDYIWSGLPIVCSQGDTFASLVSEKGLGIAVPPGDAHALAVAIEELITNSSARTHCRQRLLQLADEYRWHRVVTPLADFCDRPRRAADSTPEHRRDRARIAQRMRVTRWLRRGAYRLGLTRSQIERFKARDADSARVT